MSDSKQVKVDNWGIYFLQRLKHFFNRTDYCDLTLQFQDNAQLKVHRLVLNACTEYFEILERTCEMYEDCLIMPDDLQADVVVPIVNFMYTGQLEFKPELLEKLYQTSHVMNMPVLTKLLDAQRKRRAIPEQNILPTTNKQPPKRFYNKAFESSKTHHVAPKRPYIAPHPSEEKSTNQQVYYKNPKTKEIIMVNKPKGESTPRLVPANRQSGAKIMSRYTEPKPTRYEVPEELDPETLYDDSFTDLSYESRPLMVHPETSKRYQRKKNSFGIFSEASSSKNSYAQSSLDIVECKKIVPPDPIFEDPFNDIDHNNEFDALKKSPETSVSKVSSFFDEESVTTAPKVFIEGKESNHKNIDHAKIISEVLKKYPHLMKKNKNIKLKILDAPTKVHNKIMSKKQHQQTPLISSKIKPKTEKQFESEVLDSKEAARLIALGAENVSGPWICLICGAPGKALNFVSYYKFRRHLVEVHGEKEIPSMCEHCGLRSTKRNYMLHHLYSKHGIPPPSMYKFPRCKQCDYIGLTQAILVKHEASHAENRIFTCNSCHLLFRSSNALLAHIQRTGHKVQADKKMNLQCVYCMKSFVRENNLYAHLKTCHKKEAKRDGILEESGDEEIPVKYEPAADDTDDSQEIQYNIEQSSDGKLQVTKTPQKQKLLNQGYKYIQAPVRNLNNMQYDDNDEEMEVEVPISHTGMGSNEGELILGDSNTDGQEMYIMEQSMPIVYEDGNVEQNIKPNIHSNNTNQIQFIVENNDQYKAMVSSGQSIIYDTDGNATKTLAVLTTPDASNYTQGTTIDLNNASNEMMLFQDGYPINVTESVSENQNIVVVYSHALNNGDNQIILNAQGQIISSEPSLYQTIPKPEVTGNEQINIQHWQRNTNEVTGNQHTVYTDASGSQMIVPNVEYVQREVVQTEQILNENVTPASDEMDELPAVNLDNQLLVLQQQTKNQTQANKVFPSLPQIDDDSSQVIQNASEEEPGSRNDHIESNNISNAAKVDEETPLDVNRSNIEVSSEVVQTNEESEKTQQSESPTYTQDYKIEIEVPPAPPQKVIEKIQHLTSEWSEDEDETEETVKNETKSEQIELPQEEDSEETIENIQKELDKCEQRPPISSEEVEENQVEDDPKETANNIGSNIPPEKINTLLNDWEENESQEENDFTEGTEMQVEINLHQEIVQEGNNLPEESNPNEVNAVQEHDHELCEENVMQEANVVHEQNELQDATELQNENNLHEETQLQNENNLQGITEIQEENELQSEDNLPEEIESQEELQTTNNIQEDENGSQEENDTQEKNNSNEAQELEDTLLQINELDKPTSKSKEVPNIRSLVSDWDEDEEVKE